MSANPRDRYKDLAHQILAERSHRFLWPGGMDELGEDRFMPGHLARQTAVLIDEDAALLNLAERSGDALALRHGLARLVLPVKLGTVLSMVETERPELFRHLLLVALIAHYLAVRQALSERDTTHVLLAALCHDLGELLTEPALLEPQHRISDAERAYVYVHPISGYLMARELFGLDGAIATAVLQHQERLDGSGYPYGLRSDRIGAHARIIGVADVSASILMRFGGNHQHLSALTHLNRQKFDPNLLILLQEGFGRSHALPAEQSEFIALVRPRLYAAARLLGQWNEFRVGLTDIDGTAPQEADFLLERMANLRSMLLQFGFDPNGQERLISLAAEDTELASELTAALDEVHWQFGDLEREISRRRGAIDLARPEWQNRCLEPWLVELRIYLDACRTTR